MRRVILGVSLLTVLIVPMASAEQIAITEFRQQHVELFDAQGQQPVALMESASIQVPLPIRESLSSGFYVVDMDGQPYAIKKRTVRTNRIYELSSECNNKVAVKQVAATRGIGSGCQ